MTAVVDASVLVAATVGTDPAAAWAEELVTRETLVAPMLGPAEVTNLLRRLEAAGRITSVEAEKGFRYLLRLDLVLFPFKPFADRVWQLRSNVTSYDAWYVALAERLAAPLATLDQKLARASGPRCAFLVPEK